jgi:hypothetical protein
VNTWRKKPVTIIVADSGPLISLACADELELLQAFGRPVVVADVVRAECTRNLGVPGEGRLAHWFGGKGANQFKELHTPFLRVFQDALEKQASGEDVEATRGLGDAAIAWILKNLDRLKTTAGQPLPFGRGEIALVLTEDGPFGDGAVLMKRHAHVLSTREWLKTLERLEVIPSAKAIIAEIQADGRRVPRYMADRPAMLDDGSRSDWKDGSEKIAEQWRKDGIREVDEGGPGKGPK